MRSQVILLQNKVPLTSQGEEMLLGGRFQFERSICCVNTTTTTTTTTLSAAAPAPHSISAAVFPMRVAAAATSAAANSALSRRRVQPVVGPLSASLSYKDCDGASGEEETTTTTTTGDGNEKKTTSSSGSRARGRRLLRVREEKRSRELQRLNNYPAWAKVLEEACRNDSELRAVLGDSVGNPELMRKRVEERVRRKGRDFSKSKTGSMLAFKVSFRDFNPVDSYIWFELYGSPSDRDVDLLGSVFQSWYVMGRLGSFNSSNLQLANSSMEYDPLYDAERGSQVMLSSFHDISDVEFQDNWGRVWVDLGTSDYFAIDVLLNCLTVLSAEYVGIQQVIFGGQRLADWEEGMSSPEYGYKYFKI